MQPEKQMPIQNCGFSLPEAIGREVYEAYAKKFGREQSYERMIERGGFGLFESIFLLHGIGSTNKDFERRLETLLARSFAAPAKRDDLVEVIEWSRDLNAAAMGEWVDVLAAGGEIYRAKRVLRANYGDCLLSLHQGEDLPSWQVLDSDGNLVVCRVIAWAHSRKGPQP